MVEWDNLHLVRWTCVGVGNVQTDTEYCVNYCHIISLKHSSNTVHQISAVTRTKWSTPDTNSLLPDPQSLVILFHMKKKMSKQCELTSAHTYITWLSPGQHCLFLTDWNNFFLPFSISPLLTRNHKLRQEIERGRQKERGEKMKSPSLLDLLHISFC